MDELFNITEEEFNKMFPEDDTELRIKSSKITRERNIAIKNIIEKNIHTYIDDNINKIINGIYYTNNNTIHINLSINIPEETIIAHLRELRIDSILKNE